MAWNGPGVGVTSIMVSTVLLYSYGLYMCSLGVVWSGIVIVPLFPQDVFSSRPFIALTFQSVARELKSAC